MSISRRIRFAILETDKFTCQYCGAKAPETVLEVDHIIPKYHGGEDHISNLITACYDCNQGKGAALLNRRLEWSEDFKKERIKTIVKYKMASKKDPNFINVSKNNEKMTMTFVTTETVKNWLEDLARRESRTVSGQIDYLLKQIKENQK